MTAMADLQERSLTISGVKVIFPCKPYPSQFGMMDRVSYRNILKELPHGKTNTLHRQKQRRRSDSR